MTTNSPYRKPRYSGNYAHVYDGHELGYHIVRISDGAYIAYHANLMEAMKIADQTNQVDVMKAAQRAKSAKASDEEQDR